MQQTDARQLGPWMTSAFVVGGMIGSGIFMLPAALAPLGYNAPIGWVVSGVGALALAFALSRLARREGGGQGMQAHVEAALGPTAGFLAGFAFWVSVWVSYAAVGITGASALARVVPALAGEAAVIVVAAGFVIILTIVNALGASTSGRFAIATTLLKLAPLVAAVAIAGTFMASAQPLQSLSGTPVSFDAIATASAITLFALLGFETALAPVGKIRNPQRNIPLAMVGGTAFVACVYLITSGAVAALVPSATLAASTAPFADALSVGLGSAGVAIAVIGIAISAFGYINGGILGAGELGYAMALRGDLPSTFARTRGRGTPVASQLFGSSLALILIAANASKGTVGLFTFSLLLTTSASLWMYLLCALAAWRLNRDASARIAVIAGLAFVALAFYGSGWEANLWSIALLAGGLILRLLIRRSTSPQVASDQAAPRAPAP